MTDPGTPQPSRTEIRPLTRVAAEESEVRVRYVETPKGERLELASTGGSTVRLDAIALESLAWVDAQLFGSFFGCDSDDGSQTRGEAPAIVAAPDEAPEATRDLVSITNEFAHVDVRTVTLSGRDHLELVAPKAGLSSCLTAAAVARVTARSQDTITQLVRERVE
jgi:hypothetical protein